LEVLASDADGSNLDLFLKKLIKHETETAQYQVLCGLGLPSSLRSAATGQNCRQRLGTYGRQIVH
jgi:hypothetical protein